MINKLFAGALEAIGALFQSHQRGIADQNCGIGAIEHGIEVRGHWNVGYRCIAPLVKHDARIGERRAAGHVGGNAAQVCERLVCAANEQQ